MLFAKQTCLRRAIFRRTAGLSLSRERVLLFWLSGSNDVLLEFHPFVFPPDPPQWQRGCLFRLSWLQVLKRMLRVTPDDSAGAFGEFGCIEHSGSLDKTQVPFDLYVKVCGVANTGIGRQDI